VGTTSALSKDISGHRDQSGFNASVDRAVIFESLSTELVCLAELVPVTDVEEATTHCAEMMVAAVKRLVSGRGNPMLQPRRTAC
jgi:hypothetical protein